MAVKALIAGLMYDVVGQVNRTEEGQVFDESPWDQFQTNRLLAQGQIEEVTTLTSSAPKVEEVPETMEVSGADVEHVETVELDLSSLKLKQLRTLCEERNLDSSGKRAELIARLESDE